MSYVHINETIVCEIFVQNIYIYIYMSLSLSIYIYIYRCVYVHVSVSAPLLFGLFTCLRTVPCVKERLRKDNKRALGRFRGWWKTRSPNPSTT